MCDNQNELPFLCMLSHAHTAFSFKFPASLSVGQRNGWVGLDFWNMRSTSERNEEESAVRSGDKDGEGGLNHDPVTDSKATDLFSTQL